MKIYAIKNKETGLFLENGKSMAKTRAKFSNKNTRLFSNRSAASNALSCWILGVWSNRVDSATGEMDGPQPPYKTSDERKAVAANLCVVDAEVIFK